MLDGTRLQKAARHKGTCITPIVAVLREHPRRDAIVPKHLQRYFEEKVLVSGWYPDADYFALLDILANAFDRKQFGGDPWTQMGIRAARRDIGGVEELEPVLQAAHVGVYKQYAADNEQGLESFFQRAARIWTQYHDTGHYEVVGRVAHRHAVVRRLAGYYVPCHGFTRLQAAYVEEYARLAGITMDVSVLRSTAQGHANCEWLCQLRPTDESRRYLATLADYVA